MNHKIVFVPEIANYFQKLYIMTCNLLFFLFIKHFASLTYIHNKIKNDVGAYLVVGESWSVVPSASVRIVYYSYFKF